MNQIEIYQIADHQTQIDVKFEEGTVWLTQKQMAELFGRDRVAITQHVSHIFKEKELDKISVCKDFLHTGNDGKKYTTHYYNLDVVISVGYRVKSAQGTRFRQWATQRLKEHLVQGFTINQKRLDNDYIREQCNPLHPQSFPKDKFLFDRHLIKTYFYNITN